MEQEGWALGCVCESATRPALQHMKGWAVLAGGGQKWNWGEIGLFGGELGPCCQCLKDSEPLILGQVPWSVCEWLAAGEGGGWEQRRLLPEDSGQPAWETSLTCWLSPGRLGVQDGPCGGVFHSPLCVWTFLVPPKLSLSIVPWGLPGDPPGLLRSPSPSTSYLHWDLGIPTPVWLKP